MSYKRRLTGITGLRLEAKHANADNEFLGYIRDYVDAIWFDFANGFMTKGMECGWGDAMNALRGMDKDAFHCAVDREIERLTKLGPDPEAESEQLWRDFIRWRELHLSHSLTAKQESELQQLEVRRTQREQEYLHSLPPSPKPQKADPIAAKALKARFHEGRVN